MSCENDTERPRLSALLQLLHVHQSLICSPNIPEHAITHFLVLLSLLVVYPFPTTWAHLSEEICDLLTIISDSVSTPVRSNCIRSLHDDYQLKDSRLHYIYGFPDIAEDAWLQLATGTDSTQRPALQAFPIRRWEAMPDATPLMTENDTSISLTLFGARKKVL